MRFNLIPLAVAGLALTLPLAVSAQTESSKTPAAQADSAKGGAAQANAGAKIATVNGVAIPKTRVDMIVKAQAGRGTPDNEQVRGEIREQLIVREIVSQEATRKGLAKSSDVQAQLDLARQQVLWNAYIADFVKNNPVNDADLKAEYERLKGSRGDKEYKARHILVDKEDDAKAIIGELKKGRKFEELARQSKDPGSKDRGGDLEWNSPAGYVKPFADAMMKLEKGKYTEAPVQTQFGWHVIRVDDIRDAKVPPFEEVKPQISQRMQAQWLDRYLRDLRQKNGV
jgi:peptidyl-prolyl cis-trans isomerase C